MPSAKNGKTVVVGEREIILFGIGLILFAVVMVMLALAIKRANRSALAPEDALELNSTPVEVAAQNGPAVATFTPGPTAQIAPTIAPTLEIVEYIVQAGDTLVGIANSHGVELQTLLEANNLTLTSPIYEGQILSIPLKPDTGGLWHEVKFGETLIIIANQYGASPEDIQLRNGLSNPDSIYIGQRLYVPLPEGVDAPTLPPNQTAAPTIDPANDPLLIDGPMMSDWSRSIYQDDAVTGETLTDNYPLTFKHERFTLHYQPGTYPEAHLEELVALIEESLAFVETRLDTRLSGTIDLYAAGTLFKYPDAALRGISDSPNRRSFFLYDGSASDVEIRYHIAHELTHVVSWNTWGSPSSMIVSEGVATYSGQPILENGGFLTYDQLCVGAYQVGRLPSMPDIERDFRVFRGHNRHRFNYFGSACFTGYLIESYGLEKMSSLYNTSDYKALYGKTLAELNREWLANIALKEETTTVDAGAMITYNAEWLDVSTFVFKNYNGTLLMHRAYVAVDKAHTALWQGNYDEVRRWLDEVYQITGYSPG